MANLGDLDLNGAGFLATLKHLDEKLGHFTDKISKIGAVLGGGFAAFEGIHKIMEGFEGVLEMGAHLRDLSLASGQSAHDLVILEHAFDLTGGSAADATPFMFKLQTALSGVNEEGKSTAIALKALGLTQADLKDKGVLQQIESIQEGLGKIASQSDRATVIKDLFGFRFAAKAMPLLSSTEGLETARKQAEPLAAVMEKNAESFHALDDAIKGLKLNFKEFFAGALQGIAPEATSIADALGDIDFVGIGEAVGALVNVFLLFGKVLVILAPAIDAVSKALESLDHSTMAGGAIGALLGFATGGPVGALIGAVAGGFAGKVIGSGEHGEEHEKFADKFRGLQGSLDADKSPVSAIQKIGGGGGFGGTDPILRESQVHTRLLQSIDAKLSAKGGEAHPATAPHVGGE